MERMVNEVAKDLIDPQTNVSVWERLRARRLVGGDTTVGDGDLRIGALGSGSDYTPFLQHLGIASLNVGYGGEGGGGSYHSIFDSFDHYTRFQDPGLVYGELLAKTSGRMTLRFANADVVPLRFGNFVTTVREYLDQVVELADKMRDETERHNSMVNDNSFKLAADPTKTYVPPKAKDPVPYINFTPLENRAADLAKAADRYDEALITRLASGGVSAQELRELNLILISTERMLSDEAGLPRRPWFRHTIYAPGLYTGYGVKTLPGVREGIEERRWDEVAEQMDRVAGAVERLAEVLGEARARVGK